MVPSENVETIDSHTTNDGNPTVDSCANNCHSTTANANIHTVRFQDVVDVNDPKGPATKPECTKMVYSLSREVAIYSCLSMGIGGVSDCYALRDELRYSGSKVFDLVLLCKRRFMPLLLSKRMKEEEREDLERLYRIFVGCLEMLQTEFIRSMALQSMFPLWDSATLLIQTGVNECLIYKKSCNILETLDASGLDRKMMDHEEQANLERKVVVLQEMCYTASQMMDVNPWDYKPDTDHTKIDVETSDMERESSELAGHHQVFSFSGRLRNRKRILIVVVVIGTLVVLATALGLGLGLTKNDRQNG